ncbi:hypothetical protein T439DRAFT_294001 [Meredithblackwellia eburnea MCA 4105]
MTIAVAAAPSRQEERPMIKTSKEWVVPPRPKPGRKPAQAQAQETESSRKALNRASQRAFRERRQEYVAELEEKVRQLEQGEGEKSVFFQQQAQKAKEESAKLRVENAALRHIVEELRDDLVQHKRLCSGITPGRVGAPQGLAGAAGSPGGGVRKLPPDGAADGPGPSKRPRRESTRSSGAAGIRQMAKYVEHTSSDDDDNFDDDNASDLFDAHVPSVVVSPIAQGESPGEPCCGLCSSDSSCFCSEVGYNIDHSSHGKTGSRVGGPPPVPAVVAAVDFVTSQVAIPLRLRKTPGKTPVWAINSSSLSTVSPPAADLKSEKPALCNGDPENCPACRDDPFGKAFCNALSESVCTNNPCASCPSHSSTSTASVSSPVVTSRAPTSNGKPMTAEDESIYDVLKDLPCCGDPSLCGSLTCAPKEDDPSPSSSTRGVVTVETVPCNEAWTVLKCHPNIAFADLAMLADVVARRTRCDGPVPAEGTLFASSSSASLAAPADPSASRPRSPSPLTNLLAKNDTDFRTPALASHESLLCAAEAGHRKRLTVEKDAVNEALLYLDRAVGRGGPLMK